VPTGRILLPVADAAGNRVDAEATITVGEAVERPNGTHLRPGFPGPLNTGPRVATTPSGVSGRWTITQNGAVITGKRHVGPVQVDANDVTFQDCVFEFNGTSVIIKNNGTGLVLDNCEGIGVFNPNASSPGTAAPAAFVGHANYTARRCNVRGCVDMFKVGGTVAIEDCYGHDAYADRFGSGSGTHNDSIQKNDNTPLTSLTVVRSAFYGDPCTSNRHFQLKSTTSARCQRIRVQENFFYGLRFFNMDDFFCDDGLLENNVLAGSASRGPFQHGSLYIGEGMGTITRRGNVFESGELADDNPVNYTCQL
jgi:hypothetical protein